MDNLSVQVEPVRRRAGDRGCQDRRVGGGQRARADRVDVSKALLSRLHASMQSGSSNGTIAARRPQAEPRRASGRSSSRQGPQVAESSRRQIIDRDAQAGLAQALQLLSMQRSGLSISTDLVTSMVMRRGFDASGDDRQRVPQFERASCTTGRSPPRRRSSSRRPATEQCSRRRGAAPTGRPADQPAGARVATPNSAGRQCQTRGAASQKAPGWRYRRRTSHRRPPSGECSANWPCAESAPSRRSAVRPRAPHRGVVDIAARRSPPRCRRRRLKLRLLHRLVAERRSSCAALRPMLRVESARRLCWRAHRNAPWPIDDGRHRSARRAAAFGDTRRRRLRRRPAAAAGVRKDRRRAGPPSARPRRCRRSIALVDCWCRAASAERQRHFGQRQVADMVAVGVVDGRSCRGRSSPKRQRAAARRRSPPARRRRAGGRCGGGWQARQRVEVGYSPAKAWPRRCAAPPSARRCRPAPPARPARWPSARRRAAGGVVDGVERGLRHVASAASAGRAGRRLAWSASAGLRATLHDVLWRGVAPVTDRCCSASVSTYSAGALRSRPKQMLLALGGGHRHQRPVEQPRFQHR